MRLKETKILKKYNGSGWFTASLVAIMLAGLFVHSASSENPTAVSLIYFRGHGQSGAVVLEWATATELDTVGFEIERASQPGGPFQRLSAIGFVPSSATDAFSGAKYEVLDEDGLIDGKNYYYILVEIELNGSENKTQPIVVSAGQTQAPPTATSRIGQSTATPVTSTPGSTLQQTATRTPTSIATSQTSSAVDQRTSSAAGATATTLSRTANQNSTSNTDVASANSESSGTGNTTFGNLAQAQATDEGYPPPLVTPILNGSESAYPGFAPDSIEQPFEVNPSAYPGVAQEDLAPPAAPSFGTAPAIGSDLAPSTMDASETAEAGDADPIVSTFVLWAGFIIAMLIFVLGVVGAIYWYSRQRTG